MNRLNVISIKKINFNLAGVAPFNWQMMLPSDSDEYCEEAIRIFCELDDSNISNIISASNEIDLRDKCQQIGYDVIKEYIEHEINSVCTFDTAYCSLVKYLFSDENALKSSHKQMFWRIFGEKAEKILQENMSSASVCACCGMHTPAWATHDCPKSIHGLFKCVDCGEWVQRTNPKQCRCETCQANKRKLSRAIWNEKMYDKRRKRTQKKAV